MTSRQNAKLSMAKRTAETLKRFLIVFKDIIPVFEAVEALDAIIKAIGDMQNEQGKVNVQASTLEKREAEKKMVELAVKVANVLSVIGFVTNNADLLTLQGLSDNSLYKLNESDTIAHSRRIFDTAGNNAAALKEYGIEESEIAALETAIQAFDSLVSKPKDTIGMHKQRTTNLTQLFAEMDSIFYDRLDKMMVLFKQSHPDFYDEYRTARNVIYSTGIAKQK
jgi:hypothetical protein